MTQKGIIAALMAGILLLVVLVAVDDPPAAINVSQQEQNSDQPADATSGGRSSRPSLAARQNRGSSLLRPSSGNLTEDVGLSIAQEILTQSETGNIPSEEELLNQVLTSSFSVEIDDFLIEIDEEKIARIANPSDEERNQYLLEISAAMEEYFLNTDINPDRIDTSDFDSAIGIHQGTIDKLYAIRVPQNWLAFHVENIRLIGTQQKIFETLSNYETDPLKAIASIQTFQEASIRLQTLWDAFVIDVNQQSS